MRKYWWLLVGVLTLTFSILGFFGREVYRQAPPLYSAMKTSDGRVLYSKEDILTGQTVWQSIGGQQIGSIWGHGAYQAPDWTADWLHRELVHYQEVYSLENFGKEFSQTTADEKSKIKNEMLKDYRGAELINDELIISDIRLKAFELTKNYYLKLFGNDADLKPTRVAYAIHENVLPSLERREKMMSFFHWSTWAASANRPGEKHTYTNNWPHEPLIDNNPTSENIFWSIISVILLIAAIGFLVWFYSFKKEDDVETNLPSIDPLKNFKLTPSMKALWKYWGVVIVLLVAQIGLGGILAHYTVEGQDFYGFPLSEYLPYSVARTWHIQIALFWIATSFLAAGLFLGPIVNGGKDPKFQLFGVNFLFIALLIVVFGSLTGELLAAKQFFTNLDMSFWFGHQGYEYVDLGRFWQILLLVGLGLWLTLMLRCVVPALRRADDSKDLLLLFTASTVAIGLFYGGGLFYGARTHISIMEFWRWWVVHLWVEGFFEVFATVAIAFIFVSLGLIKPRSASKASLLSTSIFLLGGIPGTFHHLYFSGTPTSISAIGACFSALEVVPLVLVGFEAFHTYRVQHLTSWTSRYKWPITFFVGVAFWNLVGAGVFGFLINPPIALYYLQGLNTTAVHAHGATFGVYGLLSLGLVIFIVQTSFSKREWNEKLMNVAFWGLNLGLGLMIVMSLLPIGLIQFKAALSEGLWYARGSEVMQSPLIQNLRWLRSIGDIVFAIGALSFALAVLDRVGLYKFNKMEMEIENDEVTSI